MKRLTLMALMIAPAIGFAQNATFTLKAKLAANPAKVYLSYRVDGNTVLDSTAVTNGSFQFKGSVKSPVMAQLIADYKGGGLKNLGRKGDVLSFYLDNGVITVNATDSIKNSVIKGSKINDENLIYKNLLAGPVKAMASVNSDYAAAPDEKKKDESFKKELNERYEKAAEEKAALQNKYIKQYPGSFFSLTALKEIAGSSMDVAKVEPIYKALSTELRSSASGVEFAKQIEAARATSVGAMAPMFTQNDVNDKPVSLADFKGKYVLIDFWASWCGPCRAENPNVVEAFNKFKDKNFTILGVSLDQPGKKDLWLEAIKTDGLNWTQVSDLQGWKNVVAAQYGVRGIPQNYLVDPNGKIVAKNLRGEGLHKKLKELLGEGTSK